MSRQSHGRAVALAALVGIGLLAGGSDVLGREAGDKPVLQLSADRSDPPARMIATGLSLLIKSKMDAFDINIHWAGAEDDPSERAGRSPSELELLKLGDIDSLEPGVDDDLRAMMKIWRVAKPDSAGGGGQDAGYLLTARSTMSASHVQQIVETVQSDQIILKAVQLDMEKLRPSVSMVDLPIKLHAGAKEHLVTTGISPAATSTPEPESQVAQDADADDEVVLSRLPEEGDGSSAAQADGDIGATVDSEPKQTLIPEGTKGVRSYILYFDPDEANLDQGLISSVARACQYAAKLPNAKFVISGHTDSTGSTSYNNDLAKRRADAVSEAIRNDPRFREDLSVIEFGESEPAFLTDDDVSEPMNRRVVITILPDE